MREWTKIKNERKKTSSEPCQPNLSSKRHFALFLLRSFHSQTRHCRLSDCGCAAFKNENNLHEIQNKISSDQRVHDGHQKPFTMYDHRATHLTQLNDCLSSFRFRMNIYPPVEFVHLMRFRFFSFISISIVIVQIAQPEKHITFA